MFCEKCGSIIKDGDLFCAACGAKQGENKDETKVNEAIVMPIISTDNDIVMQNEIIKKIWPDWELVEKLGEGSFGKVYRAKREEVGNITSYSAIKIIRIPQSNAEVDSVKSENGLDDQSTTAYFKGFVDECVNEIKTMESLKGTQNIVSVEDYKVIPHENEIGWTIVIRMELLTSFIAHTKDKVLSEKEVIKLGIDMCNALEFCAKLKIMHRDIKPENIFISSFGIYKLGDFGIARKLEKSTMGMSKKGTYNYMAPEIYSGKGNYDFTSDIYSLGIVLYKLLNSNRFPLVDPRSSNITHQQMQDAFEKRMQGATLPKPLNASDALSNVILTACAYNPQDRFATASALKMALTNVQNGTADKVAAQPPKKQNIQMNNGTVGVINRKPVTQSTAANTPPVLKNPPVVNNFNSTPIVEKKEKSQKPKKEKKKMSKGKKALAIILSIVIILVITAGGLGIAYLLSDEQKIVRALDKENYDEALQVYNNSFSGESSGLLEWTIESRLENIKEDFASGSIEYEVANMEISTIEKMGIGGISTTIKSTKDYVSKLNTSRIAFNTAETMFTKGDYAGAIANYKKVVEDDANYETAKSKLTTAVEKYREDVLAKATDYVSTGSIANAITELEVALKTIPDDSEISKQLNLYRSDYAAQIKSDSLKTAEDFAKSKDFAGAIKTINSALESNADDAELLTILKTYSDNYIDQVLVETDKLISQRKYDDAITLLNRALEVLPNNATIKEKLNKVEENKPVDLSDVVLIDSGDYEYYVDVFTDSYGNVYDGYHWYDPCYYNAYSVYNLDKKYNEFNCSIVAHETTGSDRVFSVAFYVDDKLVHTVSDITKTSGKKNVTIDVTNATKLEIKTSADEYSYSRLAIVDATVSKK